MACNVNLWAVLVSSIVASGLGMVWYSPIMFGPAWMKAIGMPEPTEEDKKGMWWRMLANLVATFIMIFVLGRVIWLTSSVTISSVLALSVILWIGFIAMTALYGVLWEKKSWKYYFVTVGYSLLVFVVSGIILAVWK